MLMVVMTVLALCACGKSNDKDSNKVVIYSGAEEYRNEHFLKRLKEQFPDYDITIEYMPTGNLAAKLAAEGTQTDMDIFYDLDFSYAGLVEQYLADVSSYDQSIYVDDCKVPGGHYLAETRNGGAIIINPDVLKAKGIPFYLESPTNQQFVILENGYMEKLGKAVGFDIWQPFDANHTVVRFATSWATTKEQIEQLKELL